MTTDEKAIHNERTKYLAAGADRLASACYIGGFLGPAVKLTFETVEAIESARSSSQPSPTPSHDADLWISASLIFVLLGFIFQTTGFMILKRIKG